MAQDIVADALNMIRNASKAGKKSITAKIVGSTVEISFEFCGLGINHHTTDRILGHNNNLLARKY